MSGPLLTTIAGFALVLLAVAVIPVLAARVRLPVATLQASLGISLGAVILLAAGPLGQDMPPAAATALVEPLRALLDALAALGAQGVLALFLPPLLFDAALRVDTRLLVADLAPVLLLAVVAVLLTTALVAFGLTLTGTMPLLWAILLGAVVATTDPSAVLGVFREVGAPRRLQALVEGESLLNDAAAIVLFVAVSEILRGGVAPSPSAASAAFAWSFLGGGLLGAGLGYLGGLVIVRLRAHADAVVTISLALPYLAFVVAERSLGVSGVVAIVVAGLVLGRTLDASLPPALARQVLSLWGQLASWAGALVVVGATLLIPVILRPAMFDVGGLVAVVVACLVARALVLYALLPLLARARIAQPIDQSYRFAMLWGGLRGAVTVALALTVVTDATLGGAEAAQVAMLGCAFVLVTLFIQAPSLPLVLRWLDLGGLSRFDRLLKSQAGRAASQRVAERATDLRISFGLEMAESALPTEALLAAPVTEPPESERRERMLAALASLTEREAEVYREFHDTGFIGERAAPALLRGPAVLAETLRAEGLTAYATAAKRELAYDRALRLCQWTYRRLGVAGPLARTLAVRYELVLVRRAALMRLRRDVADDLAIMIDDDSATRVDTVLSARLEGHQKAIDGLRGQYPAFARALESRLLTRATLRLEREIYRELRDDGLLSGAAFGELQQEVVAKQRATQRLPRLDLRIDRGRLLARVPLVEQLDPRTQGRLRRALRPGLVVPGDRLIRRGDAGDSMFFIADGAVEVRWPGGRSTLGSGDVFGEIALITGQPRTADVVALTYVQYLVLRRDDFDRVTARDEAFRRALTALAAARAHEQRLPADVSRETGDVVAGG